MCLGAECNGRVSRMCWYKTRSRLEVERLSNCVSRGKLSGLKQSTAVARHRGSSASASGRANEMAAGEEYGNEGERRDSGRCMREPREQREEKSNTGCWWLGREGHGGGGRFLPRIQGPTR